METDETLVFNHIIKMILSHFHERSFRTAGQLCARGISQGPFPVQGTIGTTFCWLHGYEPDSYTFKQVPNERLYQYFWKAIH